MFGTVRKKTSVAVQNSWALGGSYDYFVLNGYNIC